MGGQSVGDYYARGSRVRQGSGWQEIAIVGAAVVLVVYLWRK